MAYIQSLIRAGSQDYRKGWVIGFQYDLELVERLKAAIPHTHREWRPDEKRWWVSEEYEGILEVLFSNFRALAYDQMRMF